MSLRASHSPEAPQTLTQRRAKSPPRKINKGPKSDMNGRIPSLFLPRVLQQSILAEIQLGESAGCGPVVSPFIK